MTEFQKRMEGFMVEIGLGIDTQSKAYYDCLITKPGAGDSPYCSFENTTNVEKIVVKIRQLNCVKYPEFKAIVVRESKSLNLAITPRKKFTSKSNNQNKPYKTENCKMTFKFDSTSDAECRKIAQLLAIIYKTLYEPGAEWI